MQPVTIGLPRLTSRNGRHVLEATITVADQRHDIYVGAPDGTLLERSDPFVPIAVLAAMRLRAPLRIDGTVSARVLANLPRIQQMISSWYPTFGVVSVEATARQVATERGGRNASFFSGGIDSFYTARTHAGEIDDLVFVHGFDVGLHKTALREQVSAALQAAAAELGKSLIEVETNLRTLTDHFADWNKVSHGAALACVALALPAVCKHIYVPSTFSGGFYPPHGSHPELDPLWGTETLQIVHDTGDLDRWQKLASMLQDATVQRYLRSCWENRGGAYNCGECAGCLQTMALLRLHGVSDRFRTYPPLELDRLRTLVIIPESPAYFPLLLLKMIESKGNDPELEAALRAALASHPAAAAWSGTSEDWKLYVGMLTARIVDGQFHLKRAQQRLASLEAELEQVKKSRSWRMTGPLRGVARRVRRKPL